ncbi:MAG: hypothetical protein U0414_19495 [Polyangiaceae bacterium]
MVRYCLVNQLSKSLEFEGGLHCLLEEEEGLQGFLDLLRLPRLEPRADTAEKRTRGNQGFYVAVVFLGEPPSDLRVGTALEGLEQRCFGDVVDPGVERRATKRRPFELFAAFPQRITQLSGGGRAEAFNLIEYLSARARVDLGSGVCMRRVGRACGSKRGARAVSPKLRAGASKPPASGAGLR